MLIIGIGDTCRHDFDHPDALGMVLQFVQYPGNLLTLLLDMSLFASVRIPYLSHAPFTDIYSVLRSSRVGNKRTSLFTISPCISG